MSFEHIKVIHVHYCCGSKMIPMGTLTLKNNKILFEYSEKFLETGFEISPFMLPLKPGMFSCEDQLFNGLFGVFNDSLPDEWGRFLLDRKLMKLNIDPNTLTPLDRLGYVGAHGLGALFYLPERERISSQPPYDLDVIADKCIVCEESNDDPTLVDDLLALNGSSGGARPKIVISLEKNAFRATENDPSMVHNDWIIKFRSSTDSQDIGLIEYAYYLMAEAAGLDLPEAKLFGSKKTPGYFGVKRFDRVKSKFLHMHSACGLLHADYLSTSLDYEILMKTTLILTKDLKECEKQFRNAVFNVLSHNHDDHAKNFSFLMDENGQWTVSPAYDLTFSSGYGGEHSTLVMGEGKNPGVSHLLKLAEVGFIKKQKALTIINEVKNAVSQWDAFARQAQVTQRSSRGIKRSLDRVMKNFTI